MKRWLKALVVLDFDSKSYAWVITQTSADWSELKINAKDLLPTLSPSFIVTSLRTWSPRSRSLLVSLNFFGLLMRLLDYDTRAEPVNAAG
jgi:hypothetical protein